MLHVDAQSMWTCTFEEEGCVCVNYMRIASMPNGEGSLLSVVAIFGGL